MIGDNNKILVFTDGGAIGNPGPAAIAAIIKWPPNLPCKFGVEKKYSEFIGRATNNEAEYRALIFALKKIKSLFGKKKIKGLNIKCHLDSLLLVKQLQGKYKILKKELQPLFLEVWNLKIDFKNVSFNYIKRAENKEADSLVQNQLSQF